MSDASERESGPPRRDAPFGAPGPQVPRWLASVVLIALLASAALSTWLILAPDGGGEEAAASTAESD